MASTSILKEQLQTLLDTCKILIDENEALKAPKESSDGLKTFVERSPLIKEVRALRKENKKLKEDIENHPDYVSHFSELVADLRAENTILKEQVKENKKLKQENQKQEKEYEKLSDKYEDLRCEHNELIRDSKCVDLTFEAHQLEYAENIKELEDELEVKKEVIDILNHKVFTSEREIKKLKEALNKVRRDLSPDR